MRTVAKFGSRALITIWLATTLAFFALRLLPGDAIDSRLRQIGADEDFIQVQRDHYGLHEDVITQYILFWRGIASGDLGVSLINSLPVTELISTRFVPTAKLAVGALIIAITTGLSLGILSAVDVGYGVSSLASTLINLTFSIPIFVSGTLLLFLVYVPIGGGGESLAEYLPPALLLGFHTAGAIARVAKTNIQQTTQANFVQAARAKGLQEGYIVVRHILRIGLIPVITVTALQMGYLLAGVVITETLFTRPGLGTLLLDSVLRQDYPVVQGIVLLSAFVYIVLNLMADTLHSIVDPRIAQS